MSVDTWTILYAIFVLIFILFFILPIVLGLLYGPLYARSRTRLLEEFRSSIRSDGSRLLLPEEMTIDVGVVSVKRFWRAAGRSRRLVTEFHVLNPTSLSTNAVELDRVCNAPFYVYADFNDNVLVEAPGFVVKSGRFKDIAVLCLEPSNIPEKVVEVSAGEGIERAAGVVRVGRNGIELSLAWGLGIPKQRKVVYDEKQGTYRVVEEYVGKPKARGARLELCFQTPGSKFCTTLVKLSAPGTSAQAALPFKVKEALVPLFKDILSYSTLGKMIESRVTPGALAIGYKPGYVTAKLVLDMPLAQDVIKEVEL